VLPLSIGLCICTAAFFAGRALARWLLRLPEARLLERGTDDGYFSRSRVRRTAFRLAGPVSAYGIAALLAFAFLSRAETGEATTTVEVIPDGPAAHAGMQSGDRIVTVDGVAPAAWDDVRRLIARAPRGTAIPVRVQRGGGEHTLTVTPDASGRILVTSRMDTRRPSLGAAIARALHFPLRQIADDLKGLPGWFAGATSETLSGPIGIVRATAEARTPADRVARLVALMLGVPTAHFWPLAFVAEALLTPRRRRVTP
jgi:membrane-associated protease RseP (regulator of RpoE activity)